MIKGAVSPDDEPGDTVERSTERETIQNQFAAFRSSNQTMDTIFQAG